MYILDKSEWRVILTNFELGECILLKTTFYDKSINHFAFISDKPNFISWVILLLMTFFFS